MNKNEINIAIYIKQEKILRSVECYEIINQLSFNGKVCKTNQK